VRIICAAFAAALLAGCVSTYAGTARPADPSLLDEPGWRAVRVAEILQENRRDCGAAALAMVLGYHGARIKLEAPERGLRADALRDAARARGLDAFCVAGAMDDLERELSEGRPVLVGLVKPTLEGGLPHYEVVVGLDRAGRRIATIDPARGLTVNSAEGFEQEWSGAERLAIVINPGQGFRRDEASTK
jgi:ABC-type bacteriocin/lantibiotic exporter with double-glycine peptidase domain